MLRLTGWDAKRIVVLFIALAISIMAVAIPVFWLQFMLKPPTGVVLYKIDGNNSGGWELELFDTRNRKMTSDNIPGGRGDFGLYYHYAFGQVPSYVLVHHLSCASPIQIELTEAEVFAAGRMRVELVCKP
jgi:hypothetical protein